MKITCNEEYWAGMPILRDRTPGAPCGKTYDDYDHYTICPHDPLPPPMTEEDFQALVVAVDDLDADIEHLKQKDGSCKISVNGQGNLPCSLHPIPQES